MRRGIPAEEIAFVHDAKTDTARENLFKEMRMGIKKIMIGSTDKCGTGGKCADTPCGYASCGLSVEAVKY